ncbi:MAG: galactose mutarotase [Acetobacteraceae bacterium]|nr:galactose mutarotase [Acetobacteraceae bacterium]
MSSTIEEFGATEDGRNVQLVTLEDGLRAQLLTIGAAIQTLEVPDRAGQPANVVLGLRTAADYAKRSPHFGAVAGRYAGRIRRGRFVLDGAEHQLPQNDGVNSLHGGPAGFGRQVWQIEDADPRSVSLSYLSPDGEAGYPGTLWTRLTYRVEGTTLRLDYEATTDRATVLNLTNHSYFNLAGEGSSDVFAHELQIEADSVLEQDAQSLPTGRMLPVEGTPFDFRTPRRIGERIREAHPQVLFGLGYDQCFVLRGEGLRQIATVKDGRSGRVMVVRTDQPGVQLYTANKLTGALAGLSGRTYRSGDALCLETQHYPDSPNQEAFPSTVLRPGDVFRSRTEYTFSAG